MEEQMQARADKWKDWMGLLIAVVALATAIAAWRAADAARVAGFEDYFALTAVMNRVQAETLATAAAIEHLGAFTQFAINDESQTQILNLDFDSLNEPDKAVLEEQLTEASRLAATNRNFFPGRYANQDGTYAAPREMAEQIAEAERRQDLNSQPHLDKSSALDSKTFAFIQIIILQSVALLFLTLAGALHYQRTILRWAMAVAGVACLLISIGAMFMTELR